MCVDLCCLFLQIVPQADRVLIRLEQLPEVPLLMVENSQPISF